MKIFFSTVVIFLLSYTASLAQKEQHKIIYDFTKGDTSSFSTVVRQLKSVLNAVPDAKIEVVCHGPGLNMLVTTKSNVKQEIEELKTKYSVVFAACANAMRRKNINKSQLLSQAVIVPAGIVEISTLQLSGWSYIKGGD